jgi:competence protein ComFC
MQDVRTIFTMLYNVLFPQEAHICIFDTLEQSVLEKIAIRTFVLSPLKCLAPFPYKHKLIKNAVLATKFHSHKRAADMLGNILVPYLAEEISEQRMFGSFTEPLLIPVPLHASRQRERGYNQAERIARALVTQLNDETITVCTDILTRTKNTKAQTLQDTKSERYTNMQNVFVVPNPEKVRGKDIILLDDVLTTGATLSSAQKTLQKAGARNVLCIAVAH